jgi:hypothetical protein
MQDNAIFHIAEFNTLESVTWVINFTRAKSL